MKSVKKNVWAKYENQKVQYMVCFCLNGKILVRDENDTVVYKPTNETDLESFLVSYSRTKLINKIILE